jgi:hypothetical protein
MILGQSELRLLLRLKVAASTEHLLEGLAWSLL